MARKLDDEAGGDTGQGTTAGHNSQHIRQTMNEKFERLHELDVEIEKAKETHVKPLQEQKNEVKKELRDATGFKQADIKPLYELYKRKKDAERMEEGGDEALDHLRQGFEALQEGGQLDYILALDGGNSASMGPAKGRA